MTKKTTKFTVKSEKVSGEQPKQKGLVVKANEPIVKGQAPAPEISVKVNSPEIKTKTKTNDNITATPSIDIQVDLKGLGEERQPDSTRFIFQPEVFNVNDDKQISLNKLFFDTGNTADIETFQVDPAKYEQIKPIELFEIDFNKLFLELASTSELVNQSFNKATFDSSTSSDTNSKAIDLNKFEVLSTPEKIEQLFYKSIFDTISITDDVNGVLPDDDQTALIQDKNFDTSGVEDFSYRHIFKGLVDTVNLVETFRAEDGTIKDNSSIADIFIASLFKTTDDDSASTDDKIVFSPNLGKLDTTTTNDVLSTVITFLRSFIDTTSAADSGRLNSQNYFSEEYVWEDYVGNNSYF